MAHTAAGWKTCFHCQDTNIFTGRSTKQTMMWFSDAIIYLQVRTLINEFCRITVLWDELWLGSLGQLSATVSERIKALASEVSKLGRYQCMCGCLMSKVSV